MSTSKHEPARARSSSRMSEKMLAHERVSAQIRNTGGVTLSILPSSRELTNIFAMFRLVPIYKSLFNDCKKVGLFPRNLQNKKRNAWRIRGVLLYFIWTALLHQTFSLKGWTFKCFALHLIAIQKRVGCHSKSARTCLIRFYYCCALVAMSSMADGAVNNWQSNSNSTRVPVLLIIELETAEGNLFLPR